MIHTLETLTELDATTSTAQPRGTDVVKTALVQVTWGAGTTDLSFDIQGSIDNSAWASLLDSVEVLDETGAASKMFAIVAPPYIRVTITAYASGGITPKVLT